MTSNRPKHIEPSSTDPTDGDTTQAHALETSRVEQSEPAIMKPTALSIDPEKLMEQIVDGANVALAWKNVRANRGAPGPDGISIAAFPEVFVTQWPKIRQQLLDGTYQPSPARRKSIPKEDGSERFLGIHMALSLDCLKRLGIVSLLAIWTKLASKGRTA